MINQDLYKIIKKYNFKLLSDYELHNKYIKMNNYIKNIENEISYRNIEKGKEKWCYYFGDDFEKNYITAYKYVIGNCTIMEKFVIDNIIKIVLCQIKHINSYIHIIYNDEIIVSKCTYDILNYNLNNIDINNIIEIFNKYNLQKYLYLIKLIFNKEKMSKLFLSDINNNLIKYSDIILSF